MKPNQQPVPKTTLPRRGFLKLAAAAVAAPLVIPSRALGLDGAVAPSNRVTIGMVGVGDHGVARNLMGFFQNADAQVIAVNDVDRGRCESARARVDEHYTKSLKAAGGYKACDAYADFREVLARKDIDAVCVSTPDHWHMIPSVMAIRAGKDVICEKPLTLTVAEGRLLADEVKRYGAIFQTSSENRSIPTYRRMCELVRNGRLGKLKRIEVGLPYGNRGPAKVTFGDPPKDLDYDFWLGPAPVVPYCAERVHYNFRWVWDYSGGVLTDWGAHLIDLAQWAHDTELTGPVTVEGKGEVEPHPIYNTYQRFDINYTYADGVELRVYSKQPTLRFEGTDGWIQSEGWRARPTASPASLLDEQLRPGEVRLYGAVEDGEHRNFLDCVKSRRPCYGPAEVGHRTISVAHIANIAMRLGKKLRWDPAAERFPDDDSANRLLTRAMREPWRL